VHRPYRVGCRRAKIATGLGRTKLRMAPRLIINADDFGLTPGVNRAIAELHQARAITSTTLMATGAAFEDAVAIAHANPALGVGCHISSPTELRLTSSEHSHASRPDGKKLSSLLSRLRSSPCAAKN